MASRVNQGNWAEKKIMEILNQYEELNPGPEGARWARYPSSHEGSTVQAVRKRDFASEWVWVINFLLFFLYVEWMQIFRSV